MAARRRSEASTPGSTGVEHQFLRVPEVARRLQLADRSVKRFIARGELKVHRLGRAVRVSEEDLAAFLAARRG